MNVYELTGADLDAAVARCEGDGLVYTVTWPSLKPLRKGRPYSTDWNYGGPIIERERIAVFSVDDGKRWGAELRQHAEHWIDTTIYDCDATGPTPLIAAMRCYVAANVKKVAKDGVLC